MTIIGWVMLVSSALPFAMLGRRVRNELVACTNSLKDEAGN
jgi:hypothetical protein